MPSLFTSPSIISFTVTEPCEIVEVKLSEFLSISSATTKLRGIICAVCPALILNTIVNMVPAVFKPVILIYAKVTDVASALISESPLLNPSPVSEET